MSCCTACGRHVVYSFVLVRRYMFCAQCVCADRWLLLVWFFFLSSLFNTAHRPSVFNCLVNAKTLIEHDFFTYGYVDMSKLCVFGCLNTLSLSPHLRNFSSKFSICNSSFRRSFFLLLNSKQCNLSFCQLNLLK